MPVIALDGVDLHYEEAGSGPALVLVHGGSENLSCWYGQWDAFSAHYRTIAFDVRAHGSTKTHDSDLSDAACRRDLEGLLDALGIDQAAVIGYSQGATVAAGFAANRPDRVSALVLVGYGGAASTTKPEDLPQLREIWQKNVEMMQREGLEGSIPGRLKRMFTKAFREDEAASGRYRDAILKSDPQELARRPLPDLAAPDISTLGKPLLVISGEEDRVFDPAIGERVALAAGGRFARLPGGHGCAIESAPAFNALVLDFLAEVLPPR